MMHCFGTETKLYRELLEKMVKCLKTQDVEDECSDFFFIHYLHVVLIYWLICFGVFFTVSWIYSCSVSVLYMFIQDHLSNAGYGYLVMSVLNTTSGTSFG